MNEPVRGANSLRPLGRLPDFVVIGGMKCGSTTLFEYLRRHPSAFMCRSKEPNYFADDGVFARGEEWYRSLFQAASETQVCGEASTTYTRDSEYPLAAPRLAAALPDAKLVYIMRHPVDRCYSHYSHAMQTQSPISFEAALARDATLTATSDYMRQLRRYLEFFPRDQILLLTVDDLSEYPAAVMRDVQCYLGLSAHDVTSTQVVANPSGSAYSRLRIRRGLRALRENQLVHYASRIVPPAARARAFRTVRNALVGGGVGRHMVKRHRERLSPLTPEMRASLLQRFKAPTRELEAFLGRELPRWFE